LICIEMKRFSRDTSIFNRYYFGAYLVCVVSFFLVSDRLSVSGQVYDQYLLTSYPGWVVFSVIILYGLLQGFLFYKTKKWNGWVGVAIGLYVSSFAGMLIVKSFTAFNQIKPVSLASGLMASSRPLAGLWLLAVGGASLLVVGLIKIIRSKPQ
jgi:hypothetical protein